MRTRLNDRVRAHVPVAPVCRHDQGRVTVSDGDSAQRFSMCRGCGRLVATWRADLVPIPRPAA